MKQKRNNKGNSKVNYLKKSTRLIHPSHNERKRERILIINIRNEHGNTTTDAIDIKKT